MATNEELATLAQDEHTKAVIALEAATAAVVVGELEDQFTQLVRRMLRSWTAAFGGPDVAGAGPGLRRILQAVRDAVRRLLSGLDTRARRSIVDTLDDAAALGSRQAAEFIQAASGRRIGAAAVRLSRSLRTAANSAGSSVPDRLDRALALLGAGRADRWSHVLAGIGTARSALSAVRADIAWFINRAVNEGLVNAAKASNARRLWIAEADACVRCTAYAGLLADDDGQFPGGLSWDPRQRVIGADPIESPPVHAHCRCRIVPWLDRWSGEGVPFPEALRRESWRAIADGRSLPSESNAARLRAVRALLRDDDVDLLPDVALRARRALRTHRFATAA